MLTAAWQRLAYHTLQSQVWRSTARFLALVAGRGSGKTLLARYRVVRMLPITKPWSDPLYAYCLPTIKMAKRIAWPKIKQLIPRDWIRDINETDMLITTVFGSQLYVFGMDKPQRAEGSQYDGVVLDESSDQKPDVFSRTFLPALMHREGWCWRIGVPKRYGVGAEDFKRFYLQGLKRDCINGNPNMRVESYTWKSSDMIALGIPGIADAIAYARANNDSRDYNEQYGGEWERAGGTVYYAYDDALNVSLLAKYNHALPICVCSDFNVSPMAWVYGHRFANAFHAFDELWMRDVCTQDALNETYRRYGNHKSGFEFFGDATGRARKTAATSAAQSDYIQIGNDKRFQKVKIYYPKANPQISDRYAAVNAMLCNANNQRRLFINPKCKNLRNDLEHRAYIEGTREPDNSNADHGHISDALGYGIYRIFPLKTLSEGVREASINFGIEVG
jgi:hypothetical protein